MELPVTAVYNPGTLGKGFDEVMPHNDNEFLLSKPLKMSKKNCIFSAFWVKNLFFSKFDYTEWFVENLWTQLR
jgi:hypothetical protein